MQIGFVGGGKMAEAILASLLKTNLAAPDRITVAEIKSERRDGLARGYGVNTTADLALAAQAEVVFLAVKPQDFSDVLKELALHVGPGQLVISIAAGKLLAGIEAALPGARVVRVMPNLGCAIGAGMSAYCLGARARPEDRATVQRLMACSGEAIELPESRFDAVTALSGSGPAFFAHFLRLMIEAGEAAGLDPAAAQVLARQTFLGTARVLAEQQTDPDAFIRAVASPGGTTEAGLKVLAASPLAAIVRDTILAAANRSRELSR